jgi:hypothetical protein
VSAGGNPAQATLPHVTPSQGNNASAPGRRKVLQAVRLRRLEALAEAGHRKREPDRELFAT